MRATVHVQLGPVGKRHAGCLALLRTLLHDGRFRTADADWLRIAALPSPGCLSDYGNLYLDGYASTSCASNRRRWWGESSRPMNFH